MHVGKWFTTWAIPWVFLCLFLFSEAESCHYLCPGWPWTQILLPLPPSSRDYRYVCHHYQLWALHWLVCIRKPDIDWKVHNWLVPEGALFPGSVCPKVKSIRNTWLIHLVTSLLTSIPTHQSERAFKKIQLWKHCSSAPNPSVASYHSSKKALNDLIPTYLLSLPLYPLLFIVVCFEFFKHAMFPPWDAQFSLSGTFSPLFCPIGCTLELSS
jgi:hypothetical protein